MHIDFLVHSIPLYYTRPAGIEEKYIPVDFGGTPPFPPFQTQCVDRKQLNRVWTQLNIYSALDPAEKI